MIDANGTKVCLQCEQRQPLSEFHKHKQRPDGLNPCCRGCRRVKAKERMAQIMADPGRKAAMLAASRAWKARNPEKAREVAKRSNAKRTRRQQKEGFIKCVYGITMAEYEAMLESQQNLCAICGQPETRKNRHTGVCRLHIDHDHATGKVRGLLCCRCNFAIGTLSSAALLDRAKSYLAGAG